MTGLGRSIVFLVSTVSCTSACTDRLLQEVPASTCEREADCDEDQACVDGTCQWATESTESGLPAEDTTMETDMDTSMEGQSETGGESTPTWQEQGFCQTKGTATVLGDNYLGTESRVIYGPASDGGILELCRIDVDLRAIAPATVACEYLGKACDFAHTLEFGPARVISNIDGICSDNERGWTLEEIESWNGKTVERAYAYDPAAYESPVFELDAAGQWRLVGVGIYRKSTGVLEYLRDPGRCGVGSGSRLGR